MTREGPKQATPREPARHPHVPRGKAAPKLVLNGKSWTLAQLCREHLKNYGNTRKRLRSKWTLEQALDLAPPPPWVKGGRKKSSAAVADDVAPLPAVDYGPYGIPFTRGGLNIMGIAAGLFPSGEHYLRAEGYGPAPEGTELRNIETQGDTDDSD